MTVRLLLLSFLPSHRGVEGGLLSSRNFPLFFVLCVLKFQFNEIRKPVRCWLGYLGGSLRKMRGFDFSLNLLLDFIYVFLVGFKLSLVRVSRPAEGDPV